MNIYAAPALLTLVLLSVETIFLMVALPETRGKAHVHSNGHVNGSTNGSAKAAQIDKSKKGTDVARRLALLKTLRITHFLFLGLFSGVEFTHTFLTFDRKCYLRLLSL